jgi:hypothetical protein
MRGLLNMKSVCTVLTRGRKRTRDKGNSPLAQKLLPQGRNDVISSEESMRGFETKSVRIEVSSL